MEGFTFVEKSVYVCGRFTLVGGFPFDGVTAYMICLVSCALKKVSLGLETKNQKVSERNKYCMVA